MGAGQATFRLSGPYRSGGCFMQMTLYKLTKQVVGGKDYYNLRVPREIAESYDPDQKFVVEKGDSNTILVKPATITV